MHLLVAYQKDPAGFNMASYILKNMDKEGDVYHGKNYDLALIPTPAISADWIEEKYPYDSYVFLSKHASESGTLALTCHSTGNFSDAKFGGLSRQVAIPNPHLQKSYMKHLWSKRNEYPDFEITIEATHHGPTALSKPALFMEIGTSAKEWSDKNLCESIAKIIVEEMNEDHKKNPVAICFGGTHYPKKFNKELIEGDLALGTVMPKHALDSLDDKLFSHIVSRNEEAKIALVDKSGLGRNKQKVINLIKSSDLEIVQV